MRLLRGLNPFRAKVLAAGVTMLAYVGLVALFCPAYLRRAVPLALALYGATDVPLRHLVADSLRLIFGEAVALALWWNRRHRMPEGNLMLTLVVFAITSTVICFMDGKDWFYHRLPATIATVLALMCWAASVLIHRRADTRRGFLPVLAGAVAVVVFLVAAFQRLEPQVALAVEPEQNTIAKLEQLIRQQKARTYIAFSEWIALGFPVVNNTGVAWASRFELDVGAERRALACPVRRGRGQGMADPPLGRARLHPRLSRHRRGRHPAGRRQLCRRAERIRSGLRARLVALPADRCVRRPGGVSPRRRGMHRSMGGCGSAAGHRLAMTDSPYLFRAASHSLLAVTDRLKVREAVSGFGIALRYQERAPDLPDAAEPAWCETGHSIFILAGRIRYTFDDHSVEAGPGDMLHIPAGPAHRHKPRVVGDEVVRYVLTEFE